jgi:hypothetical protein
MELTISSPLKKKQRKKEKHLGKEKGGQSAIYYQIMPL